MAERKKATGKRQGRGDRPTREAGSGPHTIVLQIPPAALKGLPRPPGPSTLASAPETQLSIRVEPGQPPPDPEPPRAGAVMPGWDDFARRIPCWVAALTAPGRPVYALPEPVIAAFGDPPRSDAGRKPDPLFDAERVEAEREFARLCGRCRFHTVGVWNGRPLRYPLFFDPPPPPTRAQFEEAKEAGRDPAGRAPAGGRG